MAEIKESIQKTRNRVKMTYNILRHNLHTVTILVTNRCNGQCKICNLWKKKNHQDISVDIVKGIIRDTNKRTWIELSGGEFLLHPQYDEILQMVSDRNYTLLSNGILADKLIEAVREFNVKDLAISCDGPKDTYKRVRGVDNYDNICRIVDELKDEVNLSLKYCINPLNTREDLIAIQDFCDLHGIGLTVGIYDTPEYYDTTMEKERLYNVEGILSGVFTNKYIKLYNKWFDGNLRLPCYSTRNQCTILPDGSVSMCQGKDVILGNLTEHSLSEIWNSKETVKIQKENTGCNGCWMACHRPVDVGLALTMKSAIPKTILNRFIGEWDWDKI